jgi:hypothetical protein
MGDIVNSIYRHSLQWIKPLTRMRFNVAYIQSEASAQTDERNGNSHRLKAILAGFEAAFVEFAGWEMRLFVSARTAERSYFTASLSELLGPLNAMRRIFDNQILAFHDEVKRQQNTTSAGDSLLLCPCRGEEIYKSHAEVCDAISNLHQMIESNLA